MKLAIILFGLLIIVMAGVLVVRPKEFTGFLLESAGKIRLQVSAVAARIVLGIVLILYADSSRYPLVLEILGWIAVVAGVVLAVIPPRKFRALIQWAFERFGRYLRLGAVAGVLFGAFLIYAVV